MKIVYHAIYYLPEYGGMESHVQSLTEELHKRGHEVHVVCGRSLRGLGSYEVINGIHVHRTPWFGRNPFGWLLFTKFSIPTFLRIARDADIVHAESFPGSWPVGIAHNLLGKPALTTVHSTIFQKYARTWYMRPGLKVLFGPIDHVFANSYPQMKAVQSITRPDRVEPYVNACDTEIFKRVEPALARPGKKILLCFARLIPKKGVRHAIEALPTIQREFPSHLYIIGEGILRDELEQLAQGLGVGNSVSFLGKRPNIEMPAYLSSGDVAMIPSFYEETSIAALETMACETPLAASNIGGLPQIIEDGVTGRLFEPGNPVDIAEKVIWLLRQDRAEFGGRARQRVRERWDVRILADRHLEVYAELLNRKQHKK